MKRHNKKTALLLASLLCVGMMGTGAVTAFAEETGDAPTEGADLSYAYTVGICPITRDTANSAITRRDMWIT